MRQVTLSLVAAALLLSPAVFAGEECCAGKLASTQKKVTELTAKWDAALQQHAALPAAERQKLISQIDEIAAGCPIGSRVRSSLVVAQKALASAVATEAACAKECEKAAGGCEKLGAATKARSDLLRSLSHLASAATKAGSDGCCSKKAKTTLAAVKADCATACASTGAKLAVAATPAACSSVKKDAQLTVAAAPKAFCSQKAEKLAVEVRASECSQSAAKLLVSQVDGLKCEKTAAKLVADVKAAGCEKSAAKLIVAAASTTAAAPVVAAAPTACASKKDTTVAAAVAPSTCASKKDVQLTVAAAPKAFCSQKAEKLAVEVRASECSQSAAKLLVSQVDGLKCEKSAEKLVAAVKAAGCEKSAAKLIVAAAVVPEKPAQKLLLRPVVSSKQGTPVVATATAGACCAKSAAKQTVAAAAPKEFCSQKAEKLAVEVRASECSQSAAKLLVSEVDGLTCEKTAAKLVVSVKAAGCEKSAAKLIVAAASTSAPVVAEAKPAGACASITDCAAKTAASWTQAPAEYRALSTTEREALMLRVHGLMEKSAVARLLPETVMVLSEGLDTLVEIDNALVKQFESNPDLQKALDADTAGKMKASIELVRETAVAFRNARAAIAAVAKTHEGHASAD